MLFLLVEALVAPGTEPPPHVHTREDELFYVLEEEFDVYVGKEAFNVKSWGVRVYAKIPSRRPKRSPQKLQISQPKTTKA